MREIPKGSLNPAAPAGTPPAAAAHPAPFWCSHEIEHQWVADFGGYLPMVISPDEMHPGDIPVPGPGQLPALCQPATGFDPAEYPNAGPAAVQRAYEQVLRERRQINARRSACDPGGA
jgi:hypothetical protein